MKVALCLSGQMRALRHCIDTIPVAFPDCEVDIYATIWDYESEENVKVLLDKTNVLSLSRVNNSDLSKHAEFERQVIKKGFANISQVKNWAPIPVWNLTRIELMAQQSYKAITNDYDYIFRSRYDTRYLTNLIDIVSRVDSALLTTEDIGGSAPEDIWKGCRMIFDGFAGGTPETMAQYYQFADWLPQYFNDHNEVLKAERTLGWYLWNKTNVNLAFVRNVIGIQINENEWYNRDNPIVTNSLKTKQKGTFDFYKEDLQKNWPDLYEEIKNVWGS